MVCTRHDLENTIGCMCRSQVCTLTPDLGNLPVGASIVWLECAFAGIAQAGGSLLRPARRPGISEEFVEVGQDFGLLLVIIIARGAMANQILSLIANSVRSTMFGRRKGALVPVWKAEIVHRAMRQVQVSHQGPKGDACVVRQSAGCSRSAAPLIIVQTIM